MNKLLIILLLLLFIFIYFYYRKPKPSVVSISNYNLEKDGCCFYNNLLSPQEIVRIKRLLKGEKISSIKQEIVNNHKLKSKILGKLGSGYIFQDYIFIIKKSAIHTCHRDANGTFFNSKQKHKSYTLLIFLENMSDSLGFIPNSHKSINNNYINLVNNVVTFKSKPGDALLFDSNLIHVGGINNSPDKLRLQFKICHYDDLNELDYYNNYNKILNEDNRYPDWIRHIQKNISCFIPGLANLSQGYIQSEANDSKSSLLSDVFAQIFYGNSKFYNLTNI